MGYDKRHDGRKIDELRPVEAKVGVIKNADGSAYFTDTRGYHTALNGGVESRTHLVATLAYPEYQP